MALADYLTAAFPSLFQAKANAAVSDLAVARAEAARDIVPIP